PSMSSPRWTCASTTSASAGSSRRSSSSQNALTSSARSNAARIGAHCSRRVSRPLRTCASSVCCARASASPRPRRSPFRTDPSPTRARFAATLDSGRRRGRRGHATPRAAHRLRFPAVTNVLVYGDTMRSPELRHEVPVPVPDPFLYAELDGARHVFVGALEVSRIRELGSVEVTPYEDIGWYGLIAQGVHREDLFLPLVANACRRLGIRSAVVPRSFPLALADHLRGEGVELTPDRELFARRRRVKTPVELEGIRRAQRACERAMDAARELLREARPNGAGLTVDGRPLTSETLRRR